MSFQTTHVTSEFHRVCQKWFPSLWYIQSKPCSNLASWLALCPNGLKRASTWASSPRSTIGPFQNDFWAYGMFGANRAPILHQQQHCLKMDQNEIRHDPRHLGVLLVASKMISKPLECSVQTMHWSCVKVSTIPKRTKTSFYWASSPRCTIRCVQNDLWAYGKFGTNREPV
jgi:hypothetical protein